MRSNYGNGVDLRFVKRKALLGLYLLFGGAAAVSIYGALEVESFAGPNLYFLIAGLSLYLLAECYRHIQRFDAFALLSPPFLASFLHFLLAYIVGPVASLFDPWILERFAYFFSSFGGQLTDTTLLIALAVFCMWRGYDFGLPYAARLRKKLGQSNILRKNIEPALMPVLILQILYFSIVSYGISLGVFGMMSSVEHREKNDSILDLMNIGLAGGSLSLFLLFTHVFRRRDAGHSDTLLVIIAYIFFILHLITGSMSGFKFQILMPFVTLIFSKFVATKRISLTLIGVACIALYASYIIVEPFRAYIGQQGLHGTSSLSAVLEALQSSQEQIDTSRSSDQSWGTAVSSRVDLLGMTSVGIAAANSNLAVEDMGKKFAESLYLAPILAFVPRILWSEKPSYSSGVWFSNVILGNTDDATTSVGMGPITWLYITGGTLGIVLGFFGIGVLQAIIFDGVARAGFGGLIVFLAAVLPLTLIPTDVGPALIGSIRLIPIAVVAQYILLRPSSRQQRPG